MSRIRCFLLEPTGRVSVTLRRYSHSNQENANPCPLAPGKYSYHNARIFLQEEPEEHDEQGYVCNGRVTKLPRDDPRWPSQCQCGYVFTEDDEWQRFTETIYRRVDTGEEMTIQNAPAGAMWYAWWMDDFCTPQDEHVLVVKTPGGDWTVDAQASNCGLPDDMEQKHHHCWVRTGTPPDITVSKEGGLTCSAGAGSIQCGSYHGFLRAGYLED